MSKYHLKRRKDGMPLCGSKSHQIVLVISALESDCQDCRAKLMVGWTDQKGCDIKPLFQAYTPEPLPDAETLLEEVRCNRDAVKVSKKRSKK